MLYEVITIYTKSPAIARPEVRAFVEFYLRSATSLVPEVGYVPLTAERYTQLLGDLPADM